MPDSAEPSNTLRDRVTNIINQLRPAIQSDGGDLELVDVDDNGVVQQKIKGHH